MTISYRKDRLPWADLWMIEALMISLRSPDPNTQVGSSIIKDNKIVSLGYNGPPRGIHPNQMPWNREGEDNKYLWVVHSEANAILNARQNLKGGILYCTLAPCSECTKLIIQAGIKEVYYLDDKYSHTTSCQVSQKMASLVDLKINKYEWESREALDIANFILGVKT